MHFCSVEFVYYGVGALGDSALYNVFFRNETLILSSLKTTLSKLNLWSCFSFNLRRHLLKSRQIYGLGSRDAPGDHNVSLNDIDPQLSFPHFKPPVAATALLNLHLTFYAKSLRYSV